MSYNVDSVEYLDGKLFIDRTKAQELLATLELPESHMLDSLDFRAQSDRLEIKHPWWGGSGSGHFYDTSLLELLRNTTGSADLLFVWEGGDSMTALRVENGKVTKMNPKITLEPT